MNFGMALELMKAGYAVHRAGWNGCNMFTYLVPSTEYLAQTGVAKAYWGDGNRVPYGAYFAFKNVTGSVDVWHPSVPDCLAEDWQVREIKPNLDLSGFAMTPVPKTPGQALTSGQLVNQKFDELKAEVDKAP